MLRVKGFEKIMSHQHCTLFLFEFVAFMRLNSEFSAIKKQVSYFNTLPITKVCLDIKHDSQRQNKYIRLAWKSTE